MAVSLPGCRRCCQTPPTTGRQGLFALSILPYQKDIFHHNLLCLQEKRRVGLVCDLALPKSPRRQKAAWAFDQTD
jgi:hypothetical protein